MFTRIAEFMLKPDKIDEFRAIFARDIYPVLRRQPGFVEVVGLISDENPYKFLSITFWRSKNEADRYGAEQYEMLIDCLTACLDRIPEVRSFTVDRSAVYEIAAGKAA